MAKIESENERAYFCRPGTSVNLSVGIVGLPNVGKSTLFNFLTKNNVPAENYAFCTIEPFEGRLEIKDERMDFLANLCKPKKIVPAYLSVTDIAGLVKGASAGVGLGNAFLENIRRVDSIFHVVRCFEDETVIHCENSIEPLRDIKIVSDELRLKDLELIDKKIQKYEKEARGKVGDKRFKFEFDTIKKVKEMLNENWLKEEDFGNDEILFINTLCLLTTKNVVYLANISEEEYVKKKGNKYIKQLMGLKEKIVPFSASYESKNNCSVFLGKILKLGYESLNLINFFTCGPEEVRSWTIRRGTKAPGAGGAIHSDFENYFVMAEVMRFEDLKALGSEVEVRKAGKYPHRGKTYVVEDGDIIIFKFNAPKGGTKKK